MRIRPDWSLSPLPSPSPSSPAPKPLSSLSPLSPTRLERSSNVGQLVGAADESGGEGGGNEEALFEKISARILIRSHFRVADR